eukprot:Pgem_evm1s18149
MYKDCIQTTPTITIFQNDKNITQHNLMLGETSGKIPVLDSSNGAQFGIQENGWYWRETIPNPYTGQWYDNAGVQ